MKFRFLMIVFYLVCTGCSHREYQEVSWQQLIADVYQPESIADISQPCADVYTSYDRSGGNTDYNSGFLEIENGWLLLADVKGPGYLSRFWFTGIEPSSRIRFVFDNEKTARIETECRDFYDGNCGFPAEFLSTDQNCFYSEFPVPYSKRLRILVSDDGYSLNRGKLFFQVNTVDLPGKKVCSAQFPVPVEVLDAAVEVHRDLQGSVLPVDCTVLQEGFDIKSKGGVHVVSLDSGGIIRKLRIIPAGWVDATFERRMQILQEIWIQISWDGSGLNSVRVPLGDFFGQMWEPKKIDMLYLLVDETGFECRLPMPFRKSAVITLENTGTDPFSGEISLLLDGGTVPDSYGYFHCGWQRSSQRQQGVPHEVLNTGGRGRLAGCLLGAASFDRSFWFLESDETVAGDRGKKLIWQGTGLEDYFNSGWYYRTVFQKPLFGLLLKRPFRTVQTRFHLTDPVTFRDGLKMSFERGPGNTCRVAYDSTVYYYLDHPEDAFGCAAGQQDVGGWPDEFERQSLMTRLWDYERFGDFTNAEKLTLHAVTFWNYPVEIKRILELRLLEYQARRCGYESVCDQYRAIRADGGAAGAEAAKLIELYENGALLAFCYSNCKTVLFIDGAPVLTAGDPIRMAVAALPSTTGSHILSIKTEVGGWPDWVLAGLVKGDEIVGTDLTWNHASARTLSSSEAVLAKGPPEMEAVPFVYPDPYVGLLSNADGVRYARALNSDEKPVLQKVIQFR